MVLDVEYVVFFPEHLGYPRHVVVACHKRHFFALFKERLYHSFWKLAEVGDVPINYNHVYIFPLSLFSQLYDALDIFMKVARCKYFHAYTIPLLFLKLFRMAKGGHAGTYLPVGEFDKSSWLQSFRYRYYAME